MTDTSGTGGNGALPNLPDELIERGHVVYESGHHGDAVLRLGLLTVDAFRLDRWASSLARECRPWVPEVAAGPLAGGAIVGQRVAAALGVAFVPIDRQADGGAVRYEIPPELQPVVAGRRVVVVDDAINAGVAVVAAGSRLNGLGASVVGAAAIIVRNPHPSLAIDGRPIPVASLFGLQWSSWSPDDCPLCSSESSMWETCAEPRRRQVDRAAAGRDDDRANDRATTDGGDG